MRSLVKAVCLASVSVLFFMNATIIELRPPAGSDQAMALAINNSDVVTGHSSNTPAELMYSVTWDVTGTPTVIGVPSIRFNHSSGRSINDSGAVAGVMPIASYSPRAYVYDSSTGGVRVLSIVPRSWANAINEEGYVCGSMERAGRFTATVWDPDGVDRDLGTLGGQATATGITRSLLVSGHSVMPSGDSHAFLFWGRMYDLGTLGGRWSYAHAIVEDRKPSSFEDMWLVGDSENADGKQLAFAWNNGTMFPLGLLPGYTMAVAYDINSSHKIVGIVSNGRDAVAAQFTTTGDVVDLNTLLPPSSGWHLQGAYGINDLGHIVGVGYYFGRISTFLLIP